MLTLLLNILQLQMNFYNHRKVHRNRYMYLRSFCTKIGKTKFLIFVEMNSKMIIRHKNLLVHYLQFFGANVVMLHSQNLH